MAKTKAKTVKAKVVVFYGSHGRYMAGGDHMDGKRQNQDNLIANLASICEDADANMDELPHTAIVDIELPIPKPVKPLVGTVRKVRAVKP